MHKRDKCSTKIEVSQYCGKATCLCMLNAYDKIKLGKIVYQVYNPLYISAWSHKNTRKNKIKWSNLWTNKIFVPTFDIPKILNRNIGSTLSHPFVNKRDYWALYIPPVMCSMRFSVGHEDDLHDNVEEWRWWEHFNEISSGINFFDLFCTVTTFFSLRFSQMDINKGWNIKI